MSRRLEPDVALSCYCTHLGHRGLLLKVVEDRILGELTGSRLHQRFRSTSIDRGVCCRRTNLLINLGDGMLGAVLERHGSGCRSVAVTGFLGVAD